MNCPICIQEIYAWESTVKTNKNFHFTNLLFILVGEDNDFTNFHLVDNHKFNFPIFWDKNNDFVKNNNMNFIDFKHTILPDKDNKIVLLGSPINNNKMMKMYNKIITNNQ